MTVLVNFMGSMTMHSRIFYPDTMNYCTFINIFNRILLFFTNIFWSLL